MTVWNSRQTTLRAIVMIGLPGSGKSTLAAVKAMQVPNCTVICVDDIREELTGSASNQHSNQQAWAIAYARAIEAMQRGELVVFDATNAKQMDRASLLDHLRSIEDEDTGVYIEGYYLDVPVEECIRRVQVRDRSVPPGAIRRMGDALRARQPNASEGFDLLVRVPASNLEAA